MEYFIYCRDNPGTLEMRQQLGEAHWSFMDSYADGMIARRPTLAEDGDTATGSMHIVDLLDARSAYRFAYEEPNYKAGVYQDVLVRRWQNVLGRKMWAFNGSPEVRSRFLVIAHHKPNSGPPNEELADASRDFMFEYDRLGYLIVAGPLLSAEDGTAWVGTALLAEAPTLSTVKTMMTADPCAELYDRLEIHPWRFGGRPDGVHVR